MHSDKDLSKISWELSLVRIAFVLTFPGFFLYHTLLGIGFISPFLDGYLTNVLLLFLAPMLICYLSIYFKHSGFLTIIDIVYFVFIVYFLFIVLLNAAYGADIEIVRGHIIAVIQFFVIYLMFKMLDIDNNNFKVVTFLNFLIMSLIIFYFSSDGLFNLKSTGSVVNSEMVATYQSFGMVYFLNFLILIILTRSIGIRFILYLVSVAALYLNNARSEFVALIVLIPVIELYFTRHRILFTIFLSSIIAFLISGFGLILSYIPHNRTLLLLDLQLDVSALERKRLSALGYETIFQHPIFGDYASYSYGDYIHNIFSAWVDLGLFGFVFLLLLLIIPFLNIVYDCFLKNKKSSLLLFSGCLISVTILLLFEAKYFTYQLVPASIGVYSSYLFNKSKIKHSKT